MQFIEPNSLPASVRAIFGPQLFVLPSGGVVPLPTGIDTERFCPGSGDRVGCILYIKHRAPGDIDAARATLLARGIAFKEFVYGSYSEADYLDALQWARYMVVVDAHESQGYALQEAMSCGAPLLVWDVESMYQEYNGARQAYTRTIKPMHATSVSWWQDECGIRITRGEELADRIEEMEQKWHSFTPRAFVVEKLSDRACMERWLAYFGLHSA